MLSKNIYDLDSFNGRASDAPHSGPYPLLNMDNMDHASEDYNPDLDHEDSAMDTLCARAPRPQLRSRPPIKFYGQNSITNYTPSSMSGSTLCMNTPAFLPKIIDTHTNTSAFPAKVINSTPWLPPSVIAALTVAKLYYNPHYYELCEWYNYVTRVLSSYMDKGDFTTSTTKSNASVLDIHQHMYSLFLCLGMH